MAINKVVYGNTTLLDLTDSNLTNASQLPRGVSAYSRAGILLNGTAEYMPVISNPTGDMVLVSDSNGYAVESSISEIDVVTQSQLRAGLNAKQDTLVSGTNIKTINNNSLLGSGNIDISAPSYSAGTGISIANDTITNTAPVWFDNMGTTSSATPINADMLEGYTLSEIFKRLYPIGAVYQNTTNVNPSTFIVGTTWQLLSSVALASENIFGNGKALGLTNGTTFKGLGSVAYSGTSQNLVTITTAYGHDLPTVNNNPSNFGNSGTYVGIPTKTQTGTTPENTGLVADTITVYTWERTA